MTAAPMQWVAAALFALAILHTFATKFFDHLSHKQPQHAGVWHLLGEVEVVFGFWAIVMVAAMFALVGGTQALEYVDSRNYTEPLFVFAIMVVAGTRPVLQTAGAAIRALARLMRLPGAVGNYLLLVGLVPLLGSFITEPAAMTLAALMLSGTVFAQPVSERLKYATLGVLFVNISIGGTLTHFAAPPVLMVAATWGWDTPFMLAHFGWKAALAVMFNAIVVTVAFARELGRLPVPAAPPGEQPMPWAIVAVHLALLAGIVVFAHHPAMFLGLFLLFMGLATAYPQYQDRLILREGLLVAFFLAGLVVLGGMQAWWLQPLLMSMSETAVFFGAMGLTAITDNAALTYLGSLVEGLSDGFKYALVAGAVAGGGLTIIANAPNPAGIAILGKHFHEQSVSPLHLLLAALPPTAVAAAAFFLL
ncbi:putative Na+/H+ antiporter [Ottowia sp. SB7-C50]|uniref:putative Na+/H+ antiporter n=1 Tax=Ottowia sp. SB7-C50 TaxID=3081231 RepID=UPI002955913D|nr:putative Na+/H+ antiporter [Ottowia sp. SB7-C50]WOP15215.1 putative Na+/H+ antiporter [Ottowia sp. SB7-C50]